MRKAQEALTQTAVSHDTRKFRGVPGHAPPGKFFILRLLKSQEIYSKLSNIMKSYQFIPVKNTCYQRYKLLSIQYLLQLTSKIGTIDKMFGCCRGQKTICSWGKEVKQSQNTVFEKRKAHYWPYLNIDLNLLSTPLFWHHEKGRTSVSKLRTWYKNHLRHLVEFWA